MKRIISIIIIPAVFIIFAFWILAIKNGFILRWHEEMSFFDSGIDSFYQFLHYPGGIFRYAGTFLTQLLYYPYLGVSILIFIWLLCVALTAKSFNFKGSTTPLCYLLPLCMLVSVLQLDEATLTFESQGYIFYNSLGFTYTLATFYLFTLLKKYKYAQTAVAIVLPLLYPIAGFFTLLSTLLCIFSLGIKALKNKSTYYTVSAGVSLILLVLTPLIYYRYAEATTIDNERLYLQGLPELTMNDYDTYLWLPFVIASLLLIIFFFISEISGKIRINTSPLMRWSALGVFCIGILLCLKADCKKSEQFRATVLMMNAIESRNWKKVSQIMANTKESPNYTMWVLDNLARAYAGYSPRNLGNMQPVFTDFRHNENFTITAFVNVPVNHLMGRFNQSHRWATEHNVQYGNRVFFLKYIVRNALMNGDILFAKKFNRLLSQTMFHKDWAENINKYIENPALIKSLPDYDFIMALRADEMVRGE